MDYQLGVVAVFGSGLLIPRQLGKSCWWNNPVNIQVFFRCYFKNCVCLCWNGTKKCISADQKILGKRLTGNKAVVVYGCQECICIALGQDRVGNRGRGGSGERGGSGWMNCRWCNGGYQQMHGIQEMRDLQHVAAFDRMHPLR